ncbi:hypothetical protein [Streptomyces sp. UG1]|uniref:hypothetical protein n=1 Tax=Streptomyces sp. UG1 TaxID=3417652 RepID=UPI003CF2F1FC
MRRPKLLPVGSPLQILLLACSFALAGYAGVRLLEGEWFEVTLWFVGAAVVHDLVLVPLYGAADRALLRGFEGVDRRRWMPYVRVPAALSLLLLLIWFPLITGRVADRYASGTGLNPDGFPARWLLITAVLFGGSAVVFVLRRRREAKQAAARAH